MYFRFWCMFIGYDACLLLVFGTRSCAWTDCEWVSNLHSLFFKKKVVYYSKMEQILILVWNKMVQFDKSYVAETNLPGILPCLCWEWYIANILSTVGKKSSASPKHKNASQICSIFAQDCVIKYDVWCLLQMICNDLLYIYGFYIIVIILKCNFSIAVKLG